MKKYTQEEFDNFPIDEYGYKMCPSGDYSQISRFTERCSFGDESIFGERHIFGDESIFGEWCSFGKWCRFGSGCFFDYYCNFGKLCIFGERCDFGKDCSFGDSCKFGEGCKIENGKEFVAFLKFEGFGREKRCTYFFKLTDDCIYVRCGCFAGHIAQFRERVKETHGGSKYAEGYLKIADLAEWQFAD